MEYEQAFASMVELFDRNPGYSDLFVKAIESCREQVPERDAARIVDEARTEVAQIQTGSSLLATVVRRGGADRIILVDGQPYEGTIEQLQADESLADDAAVEYFVKASQAGLDAVAAWHSGHELQGLFSDFPQFAEGFKLVLGACRDSEGKTTDQLQELLIEAGVIRPGLEDAQQLHASYFTSKLEKFGGLDWDRKRWHTTTKGLRAIDFVG